MATWPAGAEPCDRDPARIQFRVPNGQYTKLHLLAAFTGEADTTPVVTAQFYREYAGHPVNFAGQVPAFTDPLSPGPTWRCRSNSPAAPRAICTSSPSRWSRTGRPPSAISSTWNSS